MIKFKWDKYTSLTDKDSQHGYGEAYDKHFYDIRHSVTSILEVGQRVGSAKLWLEYFPNAKIYGMDKENFRLNGWSKEERNRFELHMVNV